MNEKGANIVLEKSYVFALRIVKLYKYLTDVRKEFVISKQMLYSRTNVGAHVKGAQEAESRAGIFHEMNAALQDASKCEFWLQLLHDGEFFEDKEAPRSTPTAWN